MSFSYDLSIGGLETFDASLATVYPSGCGWTLQAMQVVDLNTATHDTRVVYEPGLAEIRVNIPFADRPALEGISKTYESRIQIVDSALNVVQASTLIETFTVTYSYVK